MAAFSVWGGCALHTRLADLLMLGEFMRSVGVAFNATTTREKSSMSAALLPRGMPCASRTTGGAHPRASQAVEDAPDAASIDFLSAASTDDPDS